MVRQAAPLLLLPAPELDPVPELLPVPELEPLKPPLELELELDVPKPPELEELLEGGVNPELEPLPLEPEPDPEPDEEPLDPASSNPGLAVLAQAPAAPTEQATAASSVSGTLENFADIADSCSPCINAVTLDGRTSDTAGNVNCARMDARCACCGSRKSSR